MKEFFDLIIGPGTVSQICATYAFALLGALTLLLIQIATRKPLTNTSPVHFSLAYAICDNGRRMLLSAILIFVCVRFTKELIGIDSTMWLSFLIGISLDKLSSALKEKASRVIINKSATTE